MADFRRYGDADYRERDYDDDRIFDRDERSRGAGCLPPATATSATTSAAAMAADADVTRPAMAMTTEPAACRSTRPAG